MKPTLFLISLLFCYSTKTYSIDGIDQGKKPSFDISKCEGSDFLAKNPKIKTLVQQDLDEAMEFYKSVYNDPNDPNLKIFQNHLSRFKESPITQEFNKRFKLNQGSPLFFNTNRLSDNVKTIIGDGGINKRELDGFSYHSNQKFSVFDYINVCQETNDNYLNPNFSEVDELIKKIEIIEGKSLLLKTKSHKSSFVKKYRSECAANINQMISRKMDGKTAGYPNDKISSSINDIKHIINIDYDNRRHYAANLIHSILAANLFSPNLFKTPKIPFEQFLKTGFSKTGGDGYICGLLNRVIQAHANKTHLTTKSCTFAGMEKDCDCIGKLSSLSPNKSKTPGELIKLAEALNECSQPTNTKLDCQSSNTSKVTISTTDKSKRRGKVRGRGRGKVRGRGRSKIRSKSQRRRPPKRKISSKGSTRPRRKPQENGGKVKPDLKTKISNEGNKAKAKIRLQPNDKIKKITCGRKASQAKRQELLWKISSGNWGALKGTNIYKEVNKLGDAKYCLLIPFKSPGEIVHTLARNNLISKDGNGKPTATSFFASCQAANIERCARGRKINYFQKIHSKICKEDANLEIPLKIPPSIYSINESSGDRSWSNFPGNATLLLKQAGKKMTSSCQELKTYICERNSEMLGYRIPRNARGHQFIYKEYFKDFEGKEYRQLINNCKDEQPRQTITDQFNDAIFNVTRTPSQFAETLADYTVQATTKVIELSGNGEGPVGKFMEYGGEAAYRILLETIIETRTNNALLTINPCIDRLCKSIKTKAQMDKERREQERKNLVAAVKKVEQRATREVCSAVVDKAGGKGKDKDKGKGKGKDKGNQSGEDKDNGPNLENPVEKLKDWAKDKCQKGTEALVIKLKEYFKISGEK